MLVFGWLVGLFVCLLVCCMCCLLQYWFRVTVGLGEKAKYWLGEYVTKEADSTVDKEMIASDVCMTFVFGIGQAPLDR